MKKSSKLISDYVYLVNVYYTNKQNKTKILYFTFLDEGKSVEEFEQELNKIWNNIDHRFMKTQLEKLKKMVNVENIEEAINLGRLNGKYKETGYWVIDDEYFRLTPETDFIDYEKRFKQNVLTNYKSARKSIDLPTIDRETYLVERIENYNKNVNQVVSYFSKSVDPVTKRHKFVRHVSLATYLSMIHNVNLTRSGWNQTMSDSKKLDRELYYIPYHPFSCLECSLWQNRILTKQMVENIIGVEAMQQQGDILHPNCKCTLSIYWDLRQIEKPRYTPGEIEDQYKIRQKVNSLTLEKSNLRADLKIANSLGDGSKADSIKSKISVINRNIRKLRAELPTDELKKQVVAIKR